MLSGLKVRELCKIAILGSLTEGNIIQNPKSRPHGTQIKNLLDEITMSVIGRNTGKFCEFFPSGTVIKETQNIPKFSFLGI